MNSIGKLRLVVRWIAAGLVFLAAGARADTYYVSGTGGSGTGSIDDPWSLEHANENAAPGDVVYLRGGTYTGGSKLNSSICLSRSGREGKPITFSAWNNEPWGFMISDWLQRHDLENFTLKKRRRDTHFGS